MDHSNQDLTEIRFADEAEYTGDFKYGVEVINGNNKQLEDEDPYLYVE